MNLAVEYLIRTDIIKNLFETPCSLMLINCKDAGRLVITIEESPEGFSVRHWDVEASENHELPDSVEYHIDKDDIFSDNRVVVPGYFMVASRESYIPTIHNTYRHPMPEPSYNSYYKNILCSQANKWRREKWLWRCFFRRKSKKVPTDSDFAIEQNYIKREKPNAWDQWMHWRYVMLHNRVKVATELVFHKEYENNANQLLRDIISSPSSFSLSSLLKYGQAGI